MNETKKELRANQWQAAIGRAINRMAEKAHEHDKNAQAALKQKAALKQGSGEALTLLQIAKQETDISNAYLSAFAIITEELSKENE